MDDEAKKMLRMTAEMEGLAAIVKGIGEEISLSQMELICLVNFAEVGVMSMFAEMDGPSGDDAAKRLALHLDRIREEFGKDGRDGLMRLLTSTVAMLRGRRFSRYLA